MSDAEQRSHKIRCLFHYPNGRECGYLAVGYTEEAAQAELERHHERVHEQHEKQGT